MTERESKPYRVRWEIEVDAADPIEAAVEARMCILNPESTATTYEVFPEFEPAETPFLIDLLRIDEMREQHDLPAPTLSKEQRREIADKLALDQSGSHEQQQYLFDLLRNGFPGYIRMSDAELLSTYESMMPEPYLPDDES